MGKTINYPIVQYERLLNLWSRHSYFSLLFFTATVLLGLCLSVLLYWPIYELLTHLLEEVKKRLW